MSSNFKSKAIMILCAAAALNFVSGLLYIWSVVSSALMSQNGFTATQASLPYTIAIVAMVIAMVFGGRLMDLKGPRLSGTIGAVLLGLGLILSGFANKNANMIVITFGIVGLGIGINSVSAAPTAMKWFSPNKKGLISGIVIAAIGLASVVYSPLIHSLLNAYGIEFCFIDMGIAALILAVILAQFLKNPPQDYVAESVVSTKKVVNMASVGGRELGWKEMIKTPDFYRLWIMLVFSASAGLMIIGQAAKIASVQAKWQAGFVLVIILGLFNTAGRLFGGTISDRIGRVNLLRSAFFVQAVNMLLFSQYKSIPTLIIGAGVAGLCYGATFAAYPSVTADYFGMKNIGVNYGVLQTAWGVGGIIGPMVIAAIFDAQKNFNMAYIISMILVLISAAVTFTFKKQKNAASA